jgi:hypothetical protein
MGLDCTSDIAVVCVCIVVDERDGETSSRRKVEALAKRAGIRRDDRSINQSPAENEFKDGGNGWQSNGLAKSRIDQKVKRLIVWMQMWCRFAKEAGLVRFEASWGALV